MAAPKGKFRLAGSSIRHPQWFKASGEFRPPRKGEYYLSGAIVAVWAAHNDLNSPYWIAVECSSPRPKYYVNGGVRD